jgi:hypothetical protein
MNMNTIEKIYQKNIYKCHKCNFTTTHLQKFNKHLNSKINPCKKYLIIQAEFVLKFEKHLTLH